MNENDPIRYLPQQKIDKEKWDACIDKAPNGLIYAYSFYLDHMAKHWDALVVNDYETVMPLTWNKKYGIPYLYQPAFTAQLGVFGKQASRQPVDQFLKPIQEKFKLIEISLNSANVFNSAFPILSNSRNYVLDLNKPYEELSKGYRENHKRNIIKAGRSGHKLIKEIPVDEIIKINARQLRNTGGTKPGDYPKFKKLYEFLHNKEQAKTYSVADVNDRIVASAVFFFSHNRCYYILAGTTPSGKSSGASHALIDAFIKDHSHRELILDFEGSDISGLAFFYEGFGAACEMYPVVRINNLPWYVKLLRS